MACIAPVLKRQIQFEDPLAHLPCSSIVEYLKSEMIYNQNQRLTSIYLVMDGKVKISRIADEWSPGLIDIYQRDELFGESALLNLPHCGEQAIALENTKLMMWTTSEIEDINMRRPRLRLALLQLAAQRILNFTERMESFSVNNIQRRLARSLIRFSERFGTKKLRQRPLLASFLCRRPHAGLKPGRQHQIRPHEDLPSPMARIHCTNSNGELKPDPGRIPEFRESNGKVTDSLARLRVRSLASESLAKRYHPRFVR